jgi:hypothetical protein
MAATIRYRIHWPTVFGSVRLAALRRPSEPRRQTRGWRFTSPSFRTRVTRSYATGTAGLATCGARVRKAARALLDYLVLACSCHTGGPIDFTAGCHAGALGYVRDCSPFVTDIPAGPAIIVVRGEVHALIRTAGCPCAAVLTFAALTPFLRSIRHTYSFAGDLSIRTTVRVRERCGDVHFAGSTLRAGARCISGGAGVMAYPQALFGFGFTLVK